MRRDSAGSTSRREFLLTAGVVGSAALGGCIENVTESGGSTDSAEVVVTGSSTVFPVSDTMAENFMADNDVNVTVDSTGTGGGFQNHFCPGDSAINGASRRITDEELSRCGDNDVEPIEFQVGADALTVAVNNAATWVDCVTFEELSRIWREDGVEQWSDVRSDWPDEEIGLFGPPPTSGTYDWFAENVIGEEYEHTADHEQTEEDNVLLKGIEDNDNAMGYFGYAYYDENRDRVKALQIEREEGDGCTDPSLENASDGSYPMARPLFIYVDRNALDRKAVFDFASFYLKQAATELVTEIGYVPTNEEVRDENLLKLIKQKP
ncbi:PstS family phosphate ABC transporter substrate-binding protein [Salinibaculum salinum]|uniref:PstS family phosphate ABC transporter substrate-binding protein n=1 Tax=Salinibaculum salinum TaxID=3131996 RepID=UPI0030EC4FCC